MDIRTATRSDLPDIALVLGDTSLFPAAMLGEMMAPILDEPESSDQWLVCAEDGSGVIGFAYYRQEPLAEGTWNLLAIGFRKQYQGLGHGATLVAAVEKALAQQRVLIVETSGLEEFLATRAFYDQRGYEREAVIRDYWADGDDKVIYRKRLRRPL